MKEKPVPKLVYLADFHSLAMGQPHSSAAGSMAVVRLGKGVLDISCLTSVACHSPIGSSPPLCTVPTFCIIAKHPSTIIYL